MSRDDACHSWVGQSRWCSLAQDGLVLCWVGGNWVIHCERCWSVVIVLIWEVCHGFLWVSGVQVVRGLGRLLCGLREVGISQQGLSGEGGTVRRGGGGMRDGRRPHRNHCWIHVWSWRHRNQSISVAVYEGYPNSSTFLHIKSYSQCNSWRHNYCILIGFTNSGFHHKSTHRLMIWINEYDTNKPKRWRIRKPIQK